MFEIVYDDDGRRRTDGRRLDGYTISSPCEPNGSGELIIGLKMKDQLGYQDFMNILGLKQFKYLFSAHKCKRVYIGTGGQKCCWKHSTKL